MANFDSQDIALLISAVQHYKRHSEIQRQELISKAGIQQNSLVALSS
ncbi:hypothetical protein [Psychrobacter pygoscelis]|nr:hypothetical protein [Psychrobacter pygoscelis]